MQKIARYCKKCNASYFGHKSKVYCSKECRESVYRPSWNKGLIGLPANRPKNGKINLCVKCNTKFYVPKKLLNQRFCSPSCYLSSRWGKSHKVEKTCVICSTVFVAYTSDNNATCGKRCSSEWKSINQRGEKSHFWRGGINAPYHKEWKQIRRVALERDKHQCTICGKTKGLSVHHIVPYRYSQSHDIDNLTTLCRVCHGTEEVKVNAATRKGLEAGRGRESK